MRQKFLHREFWQNGKQTVAIIGLVAGFLWLIGCLGTIPLKLPPARQSIYHQAWTMLGGNPQHTHAVDENVSPPLSLAWKRGIRSVIADHPLTIDQYILCFTWKGNLEIVNLHNGDLLSVERIVPALDHVPVLAYPDVYIGASMGTHNLTRYDLQVAQTVYQARYPNVTTAPLLVDGVVYFGTHQGLMVAAKSTTGDSLWQVRTGAPVYASPVLADTLIVAGTEKGQLIAFTPKSGVIVWQQSLDGPLYAHPVADSQRVYVGTTQGTFYALDAHTGRLVWQQQLHSAIYDGAALFGNTLYVGTNHREVVAINSQNGTIRWRATFKGIVNATPLASPDFLYVGCWDHYLYILNRFTGEIVARHDVKAPIKTSPIIYRGKLLVHAANEHLWAFTTGSATASEFVQHTESATAATQTGGHLP